MLPVTASCELAYMYFFCFRSWCTMETETASATGLPLPEKVAKALEELGKKLSVNDQRHLMFNLEVTE